MSQLGKRIAGTLIEEVEKPRPAVCAWAQAELRSGRFDRSLERFIAQQPESLEKRLIQVEEVHSDRLRCRIPCVLVDHESPHPFFSEVIFDLNPLTGTALRR